MRSVIKNTFIPPLLDNFKIVSSYKIKDCRLLFIIILATILSPTTLSAKQTVTIKHTAPSKYHISGIKRIVVAPFSYTMTYHEKGPEIIAKVIKDELKEDGFFKVAETPSLKPLNIDEKYSLAKLIQIGRKAGADAVIAGEVTAYQIPEASPCSMSTGGRGEVSFCADLIDVRRGKKADHYCFERSGSEMVKGKGSWEKRTLTGVAKTLAKKFVRSITPHELSVEIPLKEGKPCKGGMKLAKKGKWEEAAASWRKALAADAGCGCALHNLGLVKERDEDYAASLDYYQKAADANPNEKLYKQGIKRVKKKIKDAKGLKEQMKGR